MVNTFMPMWDTLGTHSSPRRYQVSWKEVATMTERARFIADYERELYSVSELCRRYGISRTTAYKLINRFYEEGPLACCDRSRRPRTSPTKTPQYIVDHIIEARR